MVLKELGRHNLFAKLGLRHPRADHVRKDGGRLKSDHEQQGRHGVPIRAEVVVHLGIRLACKVCMAWVALGIEHKGRNRVVDRVVGERMGRIRPGDPHVERMGDGDKSDRAVALPDDQARGDFGICVQGYVISI